MNSIPTVILETDLGFQQREFPHAKLGESAEVLNVSEQRSAKSRPNT